MQFRFKIRHLVAPISLIFLRINEHTGQLFLLVGPNPLWPTQPNFWVGHGPFSPRCSTTHDFRSSFCCILETFFCTSNYSVLLRKIILILVPVLVHERSIIFVLDFIPTTQITLKSELGRDKPPQSGVICAHVINSAGYELEISKSGDSG